MNCQQTREFVSAYSDQELTGQQMLEIKAHLHLCPACEREWREINDVRRLLRGLAPPRPAENVEDKLTARLSGEQGFSLAGLVALSLDRAPALWAEAPPPGRRQTGRRTAYALALASVVLLTVAAPFAPSSGDAAGTTFAPRITDTQAPLPQLQEADQFGLVPSLRLTGAARMIQTDPLHDDTISGYYQGEATMAGFQTSGGAR